MVCKGNTSLVHLIRNEQYADQIPSHNAEHLGRGCINISDYLLDRSVSNLSRLLNCSHNMEKQMKLRQQQITRMETILNSIEEKLEQMEQQDYITFDLEKDLRSLQAMLDDLREEIENE